MNELNTKTIINFLPLEPNFKLQLLENYDSYPLEEQIRITRLVWGLFNKIYRQRIKYRFEDGLSNAPKPGDNNYYMSVVEEVRKEVFNELATHQESADIAEVRKSMEQIVKEIKASKPVKPTVTQSITPKTS